MLRPVLLTLLLTGTATHAFAQPPAETVPLLREIKNWAPVATTCAIAAGA
jgi:hypothetical protein